MLPSETMIWQPEFTDKILSRKPGAVHCATDAPAPEALSVACAASCHVEFHYGKMMLENPSPELLTVLIRELTGRGR
ncbi:putative transposase domain protein [Escherichia coli 2-222-05_S3_C2]|nr:putative transposase domain protein [Escherichia coli 2-222-05_S3_C2]